MTCGGATTLEWAVNLSSLDFSPDQSSQGRKREPLILAATCDFQFHAVMCLIFHAVMFSIFLVWISTDVFHGASRRLGCWWLHESTFLLRPLLCLGSAVGLATFRLVLKVCTTVHSSVTRRAGLWNVRVLLADPAVSLTLVKPAQRTRVVSYYMHVHQPLFLLCAMHVLHLRLPHPHLHLSVPHFETKRKSCDASSSSVPLAVCFALSWT